VRIDPMTGVVETIEVPKKKKEEKKKKLEVDVARAAAATAEDDGIGSLPHTPTESGTLERVQVKKGKKQLIVGQQKGIKPLLRS
jgi:hypothetical protein